MTHQYLNIVLDQDTYGGAQGKHEGNGWCLQLPGVPWNLQDKYILQINKQGLKLNFNWPKDQ